MLQGVVTEFIQDCGLGNQMFEWAAGRAIARRLGVPHYWVWKVSGKRQYGLAHFGIAANPPPGPYTIVMHQRRLRGVRMVEEACARLRATEHRFAGLICPFQEEKCFAGIAGEIREAFRFEPLPPRVPAGRTAVGVHVRRGDFVGHPRLHVATQTYFKRAMREVSEKVDAPHFVIVSDDPTWCSRHFMGKDVTVLPEMPEFDAFRTLASCDAHVISNSTFGWWAAWLGEKGPVMAPENWCLRPHEYGPWNLIPARWSKVGGTKMELGIERRPFDEHESPSNLKRAIVYPWKESAARWEELRYSLRSVQRFFRDKTCPIFVLGTDRPGWLLFGGQRVRYVNVWGYDKALNDGLQLAEEVLWMNDDIVLLREVGWEECAVPHHMGPVSLEWLEKVGPQSNPWRAGVVRVLKQLRDSGMAEQRIFSTHMPYVFERGKSVEVMGEFGLWSKMPMEMAYFHRHPEGARLLGGERVHGLPFGDAWCLNYTDKVLTPELKEAIKALLPDFAPWELKTSFSS